MHKWMTERWWLTAAGQSLSGAEAGVQRVRLCVRVTWCDCRSVRRQTEASFSNPHWAAAYNELMQRGEQRSRSLSVYSQGQQALPPSPLSKY